MQRIIVIGTTGSGKSTLAAALAERLDAPFVELDALYWEPNWQSVPLEIFRERIGQAVRAERWVIAGNFSKTRDLTWTRADTLIWLDYSFSLVMWRLFKRTIRRVVTQEDLWGSGNRETWSKQFLSRDSLFVWGAKTHWQYERSVSLAVRQPEYAHLRLLRFRAPRETERWLETVQPDT